MLIEPIYLVIRASTTKRIVYMKAFPWQIRSFGFRNLFSLVYYSQQLSLQVPAAGLGREQVHQEVGSSLGHQQQRAGGLHLQSPGQ